MKTDAAEDVKSGSTAVHDEKESFAEVALKLGGKSADEARRTGAIDKADDQVEDLFKYRTTASPVHRAIWENELPIELFSSQPAKVPADVQKVMDNSMDVVRRHRAAGTMYNSDKKIDTKVLDELGTAGYWGLLVDREYGGSAPLRRFRPLSDQDVLARGNDLGPGLGPWLHRRRRSGPHVWQPRAEATLPTQAGQRRTPVGLCLDRAGCWLRFDTASHPAELVGDHYVVNGEKLFITNVVPGRTIGLVCLIKDRPAVLVVDLPEQENENFQLKKYGLYAIKGAYNRGIIFKDLKVPAENLLQPKRGDGLTIAYHGLNLGRVALCANASGMMRRMLIDMVPWARFRKTYGQFIATRELVQKRLGSLAGLIVACDAVVAWCCGALGSRLSRRDGVHHRQDLWQRNAEACRHRTLHEDARRSLVLAGTSVRRHGARVPGPVYLRGRGRNARHGLLQVADQAARRRVLRANRQGTDGRWHSQAEHD